MLRELIQKSGVHIPERLDELYRRVIGETTTYSVGGVSAAFDSAGIHIAENRYEYPFKSEKPIIRSFLSDIEPDDVFWDVGASLGLYTCFAGLHLPNGYAIGFEPHPDDATIARRNIAHNRIADHTEVIEVALGDARTCEHLQADPLRTGRQIVEPSRTNSPTTVIEVEQGDRVISERSIRPPNIMKIDVEGAEGSVLRGLHDTLAQSPPRVIYCELHRSKLSDFGDDVDVVYNILTDHGYEVRSVGERRAAEFVRAKHPLKSP